ncbi:MAG: thiol:disulfide interchange protein DsbA/DsbL, partial [Xanthomonadales bacterium]|nr:thiol:disulfide interchange protein DsbA/DsbL [Xanthomonadales bacterium]
MTKQFRNFSAGALLAVIATLIAAPAMAQSGKYQEGMHYFRIDQAAAPSPDGKVEVVEAFSYMCSHCNTFEPFIANWEARQPENVEF